MAESRGKQREKHESGTARADRAPGSRGPDADPDESMGAIPDLMRRAVALGLTSFFTTEGAVRKAFEDTVPKDWTDFLSNASERTRSEFLERLAHEIGRLLENVDIGEVLERLLEGRRLEVKAEFRLTEEGGQRKPSVHFVPTRDENET